ncbi:hypothetical protein [Acinetobacter gyllenbergii]|uniref:hypothetical protein n=1 Tax=Acinetobacter gyllenbergii TaxID=134534 RepID=UPI003F54495E
MFQAIHNDSDIEALIKAEDFVLVRGVNSTKLLGQVSFDKSCIYLSMVDTELSRVLLHSKLLILRIGSLKEIIEKFPMTFFVVKQFIESSTDERIKKYSSDSLFTIKAMYHSILKNHTLEKNEVKEDIEKNVKEAVNRAIEEEIFISDMHFSLSEYIFRRPTTDMEFNK